MVKTMKDINNERLAMYLEAEKMICAGQEVQIGRQRLTRADLGTVQKMIQTLIAQGATVDGYEATQSITAKRVIFR